MSATDRERHAVKLVCAGGPGSLSEDQWIERLIMIGGLTPAEAHRLIAKYLREHGVVYKADGSRVAPDEVNRTADDMDAGAEAFERPMN